jgi:hypothetical protein
VSAPVTNSGFQAAMGGQLSTIGHTVRNPLLVRVD